MSEKGRGSTGFSINSNRATVAVSEVMIPKYYKTVAKRNGSYINWRAEIILFLIMPKSPRSPWLIVLWRVTFIRPLQPIFSQRPSSSMCMKHSNADPFISVSSQSLISNLQEWGINIVDPKWEGSLDFLTTSNKKFDWTKICFFCSGLKVK